MTDPIARLTALLAKLPGVGEKTAQRLAFHVLKAPPEYARDLAQALSALREAVRLPDVSPVRARSHTRPSRSL